MNNVKHNKKRLLIALNKSLGIVTTACKTCDVSRGTFYNYMNNDPEFKKEVDDIENIALDFVESKLLNQIQDDNTTATIFYLKTKGKHRGYVERQEFDHTTKGDKLGDTIDYSKLKTETLKDLVENGLNQSDDGVS